jgi:hypothetical protein
MTGRIYSYTFCFFVLLFFINFSVEFGAMEWLGEIIPEPLPMGI